MWWLEGSGSGLENSGSGDFNATIFTQEDNLTLSCAARNIQGPVYQPYHDTLVLVVRVCQSILHLPASLGGMLLHTYIVVLVAKCQQLHTHSFGIAAHISALDILFSAILFIAMINSIANRWLFGEHMCGLLGAITQLITLMRTVQLLIFVVDRFLSVFVPFSYPKYQKRVVIILSLGSWLIVAAVIATAYTLDCYEFIPTIWLCFVSSTCSRYCAILLSGSHMTITVPSTVVPVFLYAMLYKKARESKKAMSLATGEDKKLSYDWKATTTFFLMFLVTFLLILPNVLTAFFIRLVYAERYAPLAVYMVKVISTRLITCAPLADAIVLLRNQDMRDTIKKTTESISQRWWICKKKTNS